MIKIPIFVSCDHDNGFNDGLAHPLEDECMCQEGCLSNIDDCKQIHWIDLIELTMLLKQATCPHLHTKYEGGMHFSAGDVWDDIHEVCIDCGARIEPELTLGDFIAEDPDVS